MYSNVEELEEYPSMGWLVALVVVIIGKFLYQVGILKSCSGPDYPGWRTMPSLAAVAGAFFLFFLSFVLLRCSLGACKMLYGCIEDKHSESENWYCIKDSLEGSGEQI